MHSPVVIAAFRSESEAQGARGALVAQNIEAEAVARDESLARLCPDLFTDGFDVVVNGEDADRAIAILRRLWPEVIDVEPQERCPACEATTISRLPRLRIFLAAAIVLFLTSLFAGQQDLFLIATAVIAAVLLLTPNRRCRTCGERWSG